MSFGLNDVEFGYPQIRRVYYSTDSIRRLSKKSLSNYGPGCSITKRTKREYNIVPTVGRFVVSVEIPTFFSRSEHIRKMDLSSLRFCKDPWWVFWNDYKLTGLGPVYRWGTTFVSLLSLKGRKFGRKRHPPSSPLLTFIHPCP